MTQDGSRRESSLRPERVGLFRRKERKYEICTATAAFLKEEISRHLPLFEYEPGQPQTCVTTLYFDTKDRDFFRRAERSYDDNVKIRVKEYYYTGPDTLPGRGSAVSLGDGPIGGVRSGLLARTPGEGTPTNGCGSSPHGDDSQNDDSRHESSGNGASGNGDLGCDDLGYKCRPWRVSPFCFVELKQSLNGMVLKKRFAFPKRELSLLFRGQDVWPILLKVTPPSDVDSLRSIYRELLRYIAKYSIQITSVVNYRRMVYQEHESDMRITFDDQLAVFPPCPSLYETVDCLTPEVLGTAIRRSERVILEIKCPEDYPEWLQRAMQDHSARRLSKFTTSVRLLMDTPRPGGVNVPAGESPTARAPENGGDTCGEGEGSRGDSDPGNCDPGNNGREDSAREREPPGTGTQHMAGFLN